MTPQRTQRLLTGLIVSASIAVAFLLGQTEVVFDPIVKVALGVANVVLVYWARFSDPATP